MEKCSVSIYLSLSAVFLYLYLVQFRDGLLLSF